MKTVKVYSVRTNGIVSHQTNATTWGALKSELQAKGLYDPASMKAIERDTKVTLESSEIAMPTSDFTLILTPIQSKAGVDYVISNTDITTIAKKVAARVQAAVEEEISTRVRVAVNPEAEQLRKDAEKILRGM